MRIVMMTDDHQDHHYVTNRILEELGDHVAAVILSKPAPMSKSDKAKSYFKQYSPRQLLSRTLASVYDRRREHWKLRHLGHASILFPNGEVELLDGDDRRRVVTDHNSAECHRILDELQPDIIAVYDADVLKPETIGKAEVMLNMHTGLTSRYRGTDAAFWPLHNQEPESVGVTIHVLDEGINTGPVLRVGQPELAPDDDEYTVFAKCVRDGTELFVDALRDALDGRVEGEPQHFFDGTTHRAVDRTAFASRKVVKLVAGGLINRHGATTVDGLSRG